jgi:hypothetical protein
MTEAVALSTACRYKAEWLLTFSGLRINGDLFFDASDWRVSITAYSL